jgi:hypothetical protein
VKARKVKGLEPAEPLADNAERIVRVRLDEMCGFMPQAADPNEVVALHDMRIAAKRLRYILEITAPVFGDYASTAVRLTKDVQDLLGEIHDCDVQIPEVQAFLDELVAEDAEQLVAAAGNAGDLDPSAVRRRRTATTTRAWWRCSCTCARAGERLRAVFLELWRDYERKRLRGSARIRRLRTVTITVVSDTSTERVAAQRTSPPPSCTSNRELSWLEFNERVLELAEDDRVPLLERAKFCAIVSSNLDEFFMVRVAGLHDQIEAGIETPLQDGRTPRATLEEARRIVREHIERQSRCLELALRPALSEHGSASSASTTSTPRSAARSTSASAPDLPGAHAAGRRARPAVPVHLQPLAVARRARARPGHRVETFARVKVPKEMLPRFVPTGDGYTFVPLEDLIAKHLDTLFPGMEIVDYDVFRVTRDADFTVSDEADDLLRRSRTSCAGAASATSCASRSARMSPAIREQITGSLEVEDEDVFEVTGLLDLQDLWDLVKVPGHSDLRDKPWTPVTQPRLQPDEDESPDVMAAMRKGDILLHHPTTPFSTSVERFVEQAVADPTCSRSSRPCTARATTRRSSRR